MWEWIDSFPPISPPIRQKVQHDKRNIPKSNYDINHSPTNWSNGHWHRQMWYCMIQPTTSTSPPPGFPVAATNENPVHQTARADSSWARAPVTTIGMCEEFSKTRSTLTHTHTQWKGRTGGWFFRCKDAPNASVHGEVRDSVVGFSDKLSVWARVRRRSFVTLNGKIIARDSVMGSLRAQEGFERMERSGQCLIPLLLGQKRAHILFINQSKQFTCSEWKVKGYKMNK